MARPTPKRVSIVPVMREAAGDIEPFRMRIADDVQKRWPPSHEPLAQRGRPVVARHLASTAAARQTRRPTPCTAVAPRHHCGKAGDDAVTLCDEDAAVRKLLDRHRDRVGVARESRLDRLGLLSDARRCSDSSISCSSSRAGRMEKCCVIGRNPCAAIDYNGRALRGASCCPARGHRRRADRDARRGAGAGDAESHRSTAALCSEVSSNPSRPDATNWPNQAARIKPCDVWPFERSR